MVQVYGLFAAEKIIGEQVWKEFPRYKSKIHPERRRTLEVVWSDQAQSFAKMIAGTIVQRVEIGISEKDATKIEEVVFVSDAETVIFGEKPFTQV